MNGGAVQKRWEKIRCSLIKVAIAGERKLHGRLPDCPPEMLLIPAMFVHQRVR